MITLTYHYLQQQYINGTNDIVYNIQNNNTIRKWNKYLENS